LGYSFGLCIVVTVNDVQTLTSRSIEKVQYKLDPTTRIDRRVKVKVKFKRAGPLHVHGKLQTALDVNEMRWIEDLTARLDG
jgi:hypothetical protein